MATIKTPTVTTITTTTDSVIKTKLFQVEPISNSDIVASNIVTVLWTESVVQCCDLREKGMWWITNEDSVQIQKMFGLWGVRYLGRCEQCKQIVQPTATLAPGDMTYWLTRLGECAMCNLAVGLGDLREWSSSRMDIAVCRDCFENDFEVREKSKGSLLNPRLKWKDLLSTDAITASATRPTGNGS